MLDPTSEIARLAAARLAELDAGLPAATERVLAGQDRPRYRGVGGLDANTALTLAGFLLGLVQFGWSVYRDHRQDAEKKEILIRRLTIRIEQTGGDSLLPQGRRDRVIEVVAEEILSREGSLS
jgi:hypothetical protein